MGVGGVTERTFEEAYAAYADSVRRRLSNPSCLMCGDASDKAMEAIDGYDREVEGVHLCWRCCNFAATAYARKHGGLPPDIYVEVDRPFYQKARISRSLAKSVFERDAYRCVSCGDHRDLTCDHIIAESRGGPTEFENLQTMCRSCNSRKGTG
jgi:hypothetical protein